MFSASGLYRVRLGHLITDLPIHLIRSKSIQCSYLLFFVSHRFRVEPPVVTRNVQSLNLNDTICMWTGFALGGSPTVHVTNIESGLLSRYMYPSGPLVILNHNAVQCLHGMGRSEVQSISRDYLVRGFRLSL